MKDRTMKKIIYITVLAAAFLAAATSCLKEEFVNQENEPQGKGLVFCATLEDADTKTTIGDGNKISWETTDSISVNGVIYKAVPDKFNRAYATFQKVRNGDPDPSAPFKAYYPASIYDSTSKTATLPATQIYKAENSVAAVLPMYAYSEVSGGKVETVTLQFKNLCGMMKFTLKSSSKTKAEAESESVRYISIKDTLKALSGCFTVSEDAAAVLDSAAVGGITLDCGADGVLLDETGKTFYVAVPTGSYERLKIEYNTKDFVKICEKRANKTATVERNKLYSFNQTPSFRPDWFYFEAVKAGAKVALVKPSEAVAPPTAPSLSYSTDGGTNWTDYTIADTIPANGLTAGQRIYFKANTPNTAFGAASTTNKDYYYFATTDSVKVGGNIMYLLNGSDPAAATVSPHCFKSLFDVSNEPEGFRKSFIVSASDLKLPATELSHSCYYRMFASCKMLKTVPALPATTLKNSCYYNMFNCCSALEAAPALPATKLDTMCYCGMFQSCTSLVTAPDLPATELAKSCCSQMFNGCNALVTAPALPATTLAHRCYFKMFCDCSALENPPSLPATELADNCYEQMFTSCSTLVAAPPLPAEVLKPGCYQMIFSKCVKLNSVTMLAKSGFDASNALNLWLGQGAGSQASERKVFVAKGKVEDVKATVPDDPNWKSGVQEIE